MCKGAPFRKRSRFSLGNLDGNSSDDNSFDDYYEDDEEEVDQEEDEEEEEDFDVDNEEEEDAENYSSGDLETETDEELESDPEMNSEGNDHGSQGNENGGGYNADQSSPGNYSLASPPFIPVFITDGYTASDLLMVVSLNTEMNKVRTVDEALLAMDELVKKATEEDQDPPVQPRGGGEGANDVEETLKKVQELEEIMRMVEVGDPQSNFEGLDPFGEGSSGALPRKHQDNEPLHAEATRATAIIDVNPSSIVQLFMDTRLWASAFSDIVSRVTPLGVVLEGVEGSYEGMVQVMSAEFHLSTPLVPTRKSYFARFCSLLPCGSWGVVDVSLENILPSPEVRFRRKPSGCLIQAMPDGTSKVTWVEQVEADNRCVHNLFRHIVTSGFAYGASRWIAALVRHSRWVQNLSRRDDAGVMNVPEVGREGLLRLSERMRRNFFQVFSGSTETFWMPVLPAVGTEDVRMIRYGHFLPLPGITSRAGSTVAFTTSIWLPTPPDTVFNLLRHEYSRLQWDLLAKQHFIRELAHVINGDNAANRVSILQVNSLPGKVEVLYLQESYTDETGSYVVFAPIDVLGMSMIMNGGNPDHTTVLSSGFTILPHKPPSAAGETGTILTISFHIADGCRPQEFLPPESILVVDRIVKETVASIKAALGVL